MLLKNSWEIGRIFGIPLKIHISWFFVFVLVSWSFAHSIFPTLLPGSLLQYWVMGIVSAFLLFISVVVHELGHCMVALRYQIPIEQITLFIFGGMAQIRREAPTPKAEFLIAIAGPIVSVLIAVGFWGITSVSQATPAVAAVTEYLEMINFVLALFNLVPGYPLDGGRVLRAGLWAWFRNYHKATRVAARAGQAFAVLFIIRGAYVSLEAPLGGVWFLLIGVFLFTSAQQSYRQVSFHESLAGRRVGDAMTSHVITLNPGQPVSEAVQQYFLRFGFSGFPVVQDGRLVGILSLKEIKALPRDRWETTTVGNAMAPATAQAIIHPDDSIVLAMDRLMQDDAGPLIIMQADKVVGILTRSSIWRYLDLMKR